MVGVFYLNNNGKRILPIADLFYLNNNSNDLRTKSSYKRFLGTRLVCKSGSECSVLRIS